jgi:hypothetical protein
MRFVAACRRLASACATLFGPQGAVSDLARQRGQSRQTIYRDTEEVLDAVDGTVTQQRLQQLEQTLAQAQTRIRELEDRLAQAVLIDADRQAEFACTAQAEGISLPQARRLLQVLLRQRTPSVAQLGQYTAGAARRASARLAVIDPLVRPQVQQAAADEIFCGRQPTLMVVEPESLCWLSGRLVAHRDGATWAEELGRYPALEYLVSDAGSGLCRGRKEVNATRAAARQAPLAHGFDVFHTQRGGRKALRVTQGRGLRAVKEASQQQQRLEHDRWLGKPVPGRAGALSKAWRRAEQEIDAAAAAEAAWQEVVAALGLFRPDGHLNDRATAEAALARALPRLAGPEWAEVRGWLRRPETFTFLDRVHRRLRQAVPDPQTLTALLAVQRCERLPGCLRGEGPAAAAARGVLLARTVQLAKGEPQWRSLLAEVQRILANAWRASSLVEGINSVLRMHQARHRRLTQGLLDLKRLYWNCRRFRTGKRKGQSPYQKLGITLPEGSWWELLNRPPEQLEQRLSVPKVAA